MKNSLLRIISLILALFTLTLCLGACADNGVEDETTAASVNATTTAADDVAETAPLTDEWGRPYIASPTAEGTKFADGTVITVLLREDITWNRDQLLIYIDIYMTTNFFAHISNVKSLTHLVLG